MTTLGYLGVMMGIAALGCGSGGTTAGAGGTTGWGNGGAAGGATGGAAGGAAGGGGSPDMSCSAPSDCRGQPFISGAYCDSPSWSCIDGRCTWECTGGRTCMELPNSGCLRCQGSTVPDFGCVGTPCAIDATRVASVVRLNCDGLPPIDLSTWSCTGQWAIENAGGDRPLCTIQPTGTSIERWTVSCGGCVTVVEMRP